MPRKLWLLLLPLLVYLATGFAQIERDERAIVRRFGKVVARPGPGLWFGFPWGIDRVDRIKVQTVRQLSIGVSGDQATDPGDTLTGQYLTGDQNLVHVKLNLTYAVNETDSDLDNFLMNRDLVDGVLTRETETLTAQWIARCRVDEILAGRAALTNWLLLRLPNELVKHQLGIALQRVSVESLSAPEEVRDAFEAVNQAQTGMQTRVNQAHRERDRLESEANSFKFRLESEAKAYKNEKETLATAEANAFTERQKLYQELRSTNSEFLAGLWREELGKLLMEMKSRGRIEVLDHYLGPDGLDITQFLPTKKR